MVIMMGRKMAKKGQGLLGHAKGRATQGEEQHGDGDHHDVFRLEAPDHSAHAGVDGSCGGDDLERAAHHKHKGNHFDGFLDAQSRCFEHCVDALAKIHLIAGLGIHAHFVHLMIGACDGHFAAVDLGGVKHA